MESTKESNHRGTIATADKSKQVEKYAYRMAFARFVEDTQAETGCWNCCGLSFRDRKDIHRHIGGQHRGEIEDLSNDLLKNGHPEARWKRLKKCDKEDDTVRIVPEDYQLPVSVSVTDVFPWLPVHDSSSEADDNGQVLLFYKYRSIPKVEHLYAWQQELCRRLNLTGKVRTGCEGINATVAGSLQATETYIHAFLQHPWFSDMTTDDFKKSEGNQKVFPKGLVIGIYEEIVPMGIKPALVTPSNTGEHLSPEQFHAAIEEHLNSPKKDNAVFIDCRNFYESKIGVFREALAPDIRKFSYWPEYVDTNADLFRDKRVFMYCTGGIRCERGAAYVKAKTAAKEVYQLKGGIHKYIEKYPDGHFRGKLFVFDDRYAIKANDEVIAACSYCSLSWDSYTPCSSPHCHQLVLSCTQCQAKGHTACCDLCQHNTDLGQHKEECSCTRQRKRIPLDSLPPVT